MPPLRPLFLLFLLAATAAATPAVTTTTTHIHTTPRILATAAAPTPAATPATPAATPAAPAAPRSNLTTIMSRKGCKSFAALLTSIPDVLSTFESVLAGGLTVFCPTDHAVAAFMPQYKNLTADGKASLLLYHGAPVYNSLSSLKTSNGDMNTLATDGTNRNFNFTVQDAGEDVTLKTGVTTAAITSTLVDAQPLAIFAINDVLQPRELFKVAEPPAPAPAPEPAKKKKKGAKAEPPAADSPDSPADQKAADDSANGSADAGWRRVVAPLAMAAMGGGILML